MSQAITDIYKANAETIRKDVLPQMFLMNDTVSAKILGNIEKHQITKTPNGSDFRAPIETGNRAQFGTASLAGGSLGLGGSFTVEQLVQTYFFLKLGFQINRDASWGTQNSTLSVVDAWKDSIKKAIPLFQNYDDASFFNMTGNQGLIALVTAVSGTTLTFDTAFGSNLLFPGQVFEAYNSSLVQQTAVATVDNLPYIASQDPVVRTAVVANVPGGWTPTVGDYLAFQGAGSTPTWLNGLYYVNDNSTSGTYLGANRATVPRLVSNGYNMNGSLTPQAVMLIKHRIYLQFGKLPKTLKGIMNVGNQATILNSGLNISTWFRNGGKREKMPDLLPMEDDQIDLVGIPSYLSPHANQTRFDIVNSADWGRVWFGPKKVDFYTDKNGDPYFELRGTNGAPATADLFYLCAAYNYYNVRPAGAGYVYGTVLPAGY